jgi:hypothetical protein
MVHVRQRYDACLNHILLLKFASIKQKINSPSYITRNWKSYKCTEGKHNKNKQTDASCTNLVVLYFYYFNTTWVICNFFKDKQSSCQVLNMAAVLWLGMCPYWNCLKTYSGKCKECVPIEIAWKHTVISVRNVFLLKLLENIQW